MRCPKCGREYPRLLALSREDNKTMICDECGMREALEAKTDYQRRCGMEDKNEIVLLLKQLLKATRAGRNIEDMLFDEKREIVTILYEDGFKREVNVAADSGRAMIVDTLKVIH